MARAVAFLCGVGLAIVALLGWRLPATGATPGAVLSVTASPTGELTVEPTGKVLAVDGLRAGAPAVVGQLAVRNQTGSVLRAAIELDPDTHDLDGKIRIRVTDGGRVVSEALLGARGSEPHPVVLSPGERHELLLSAALPAGTTKYEGRVVSIPVRFVVSNAGRPE